MQPVTGDKVVLTVALKSDAARLLSSHRKLGNRQSAIGNRQTAIGIGNRAIPVTFLKNRNSPICNLKSSI
jgi:hypothetical protein